MRLINLSLNTQAQKSPYPVMLNIISLPFTFFFSWNIESVQYTYKKEENACAFSSLNLFLNKIITQQRLVYTSEPKSSL